MNPQLNIVPNSNVIYFNKTNNLVQRNSSVSDTSGNEDDDDEPGDGDINEQDSSILYPKHNNEQLMQDNVIVKNSNNQITPKVNEFVTKRYEHLNAMDIQTEMKINFSVDRILNDVGGDCERFSDKNFIGTELSLSKIKLQTNQCHKTILSVDNLLSSSSASSNIVQNQNHLNKSLVRPMPMRYLQPNTVPLVSGTSGYQIGTPPRMATYFKYPNINYQHQHISQCTPNIIVASDKLLSTHSHQMLYQFGSHHDNCNSNHSSPSVPTNAATSSEHTKRKRSWSRAVFSQLQRKGLEIQFQIQKYITKPDRRKLAARLGLTDAQVKVWFQNRRMKWRHTRETKMNSGKNSTTQKNNTNNLNQLVAATSGDDDFDDFCSVSSSDNDEIDVVAD